MWSAKGRRQQDCVALEARTSSHTVYRGTAYLCWPTSRAGACTTARVPRAPCAPPRRRLFEASAHLPARSFVWDGLAWLAFGRWSAAATQSIPSYSSAPPGGCSSKAASESVRPSRRQHRIAASSSPSFLSVHPSIHGPVHVHLSPAAGFALSPFPSRLLFVS